MMNKFLVIYLKAQLDGGQETTFFKEWPEF